MGLIARILGRQVMISGASDSTEVARPSVFNAAPAIGFPSSLITTAPPAGTPSRPVTETDTVARIYRF